MIRNKGTRSGYIRRARLLASRLRHVVATLQRDGEVSEEITALEAQIEVFARAVQLAEIREALPRRDVEVVERFDRFRREREFANAQTYAAWNIAVVDADGMRSAG